MEGEAERFTLGENGTNKAKRIENTEIKTYVVNYENKMKMKYRENKGRNNNVKRVKDRENGIK